MDLWSVNFLEKFRVTMISSATIIREKMTRGYFYWKWTQDFVCLISSLLENGVKSWTSLDFRNDVTFIQKLRYKITGACM